MNELFIIIIIVCVGCKIMNEDGMFIELLKK